MGAPQDAICAECAAPAYLGAKLPLAAGGYAVCVVSLATGILALSLRGGQTGEWPQFGVLVILAMAASSLKITLPGNTYRLSATYMVSMVGVMMLGFPQTLLLGMTCAAGQCLWHPRQTKLVHLVFNLSSALISSACCWAIYHDTWPVIPLPARLLVTALAYFLTNTLCVAGMVALTEERELWRVWPGDYFWTAPQYLVGAAAAALIRMSTGYFGWQWTLLALAAAYLIGSTYRLYLARLEEEKRHAVQMADLHLRIIEALALAIQAKDESTHDHLRRVQVYATEIARELGATEDEMKGLRAGALLHDIGKLAVPEYILSKPGRLTPEEFERIKIHPVVGAEILRRVRFPYPVVPIVEAHHEKWDGTGYPHGLKGEEIPLGARILSAVDCLDALASDRHYRRAMPLEEAMDFIVSQSGTAFDARVVDVLKRRYLKLEEMARNAAAPDTKLCTNLLHQRAAAPAAGFEPVPGRNRATGEAPEFTATIAAARQEFQMLHEVTSELGNSLSMEGTMSLLADRLKSIVPHHALAIYVRDQERLVPQYVDGKDSERLSALEIPVGQGLSGWVAENRKAIVNGNPCVEPGYVEDLSGGGRLQSAISVPLLDVGGVLGVLTLYHSARDAFTKDHLRLLLALSSKAARTIENALKYREAQKSSVTDELTGLANTRSLFLHLDSEVARCKRNGTALAVLVVDLDGFKQVNDRFGHLVGDKVLQLVAQGLRNVCREYDYVARMGGDEFVLVLPGMPSGAVRPKVEDLSLIVTLAGRECTGEEMLTMSAGEAHYPPDGLSAEELLAEADRRMYLAKQARRLENECCLLPASNGTAGWGIVPAR